MNEDRVLSDQQVVEAAAMVAREADQLLGVLASLPDGSDPLSGAHIAQERRNLLVGLRVRVDQVAALAEELLPGAPVARQVADAQEHVRAVYRRALLRPFQR